MVHSKPEYAESIKLLTFSQLRKLEKIDAKKAREEKLIELAKEGVIAGGRAAQGLFSNQIVGTLAGLLILLQFPGAFDAAGSAAIKLGGDLANAVRTGFAEIPTASPPFGPGGQFCFTIRAPITGQAISEACFPSAAERNQVLAEFKNRAGLLQGLYVYTTSDSGA
jgi:hypothetical protein